MVKTHPESRFRIMSLAEIRDTRDVILQTEDAAAKFEDGHKIYLCEVVSQYAFDRKPTIDTLTTEIVKVNEDNRRLRNRNERLERDLRKAKAAGGAE